MSMIRKPEKQARSGKTKKTMDRKLDRKKWGMRKAVQYTSHLAWGRQSTRLGGRYAEITTGRKQKKREKKKYLRAHCQRTRQKRGKQRELLGSCGHQGWRRTWLCVKKKEAVLKEKGLSISNIGLPVMGRKRTPRGVEPLQKNLAVGRQA